MKRLTKEEFINKARMIHGDKYDYSLVDYKNSFTNVKIICPTHGVFEQLPNNHVHIKHPAECPYCANKKINTEKFIQQAKKVHGDKYDYSLANYKNNDTVVKIICPIHGVFEQTPTNHVNNKHGCPKCSKKYSPSTSEFIERAKKIHGDNYNYNLIKYKKSHEKIKVICPIHGVFEITAAHFLEGQGCPHCKESRGEKRIRKFLNENNISFFKQYKNKNLKDKSLLSYDFYLQNKNLLIEYNGEQHYKYKKNFHKDLHEFHKQLHHDWLKRKYARDNNINLLVIPYWNFDSIEKILKENLEV